MSIKKKLIISTLFVIALRIFTLNKPTPAYAKIFTEKAIHKESSQEIPEAIQLYQKAVYHDPKLAEPFLHLAIIYYNKSNMNLALQYFQHVTALNPKGKKYSRAYFEVAKQLIENSKSSEAIGYLKKAIELDISQIQPYYYLGYASFMVNDIESTQSQLKILKGCSYASTKCRREAAPYIDELEKLLAKDRN